MIGRFCSMAIKYWVIDLNSSENTFLAMRNCIFLQQEGIKRVFEMY